VNDVIMPPIGMLMGKVDFSDLAIALKEKSADAPAVVVKYGSGFIPKAGLLDTADWKR
jgi:large conductance mechanosensitive channel